MKEVDSKPSLTPCAQTPPRKASSFPTQFPKPCLTLSCWSPPAPRGEQGRFYSPHSTDKETKVQTDKVAFQGHAAGSNQSQVVWGSPAPVWWSQQGTFTPPGKLACPSSLDLNLPTGKMGGWVPISSADLKSQRRSHQCCAGPEADWGAGLSTRYLSCWWSQLGMGADHSLPPGWTGELKLGSQDSASPSLANSAPSPLGMQL